MKENHRVQWIITIAAIVIVVVCAAIIISNKLNNDRIKRDAAAYSQMIQPLEMELDTLEKELAKLESAENPRFVTIQTMEACCLSPDDLLRDLLPVIDTLNVPFSIVLAENKLPGGKNNITPDEFRALLTKGMEYLWEYDGQSDLNAWYSGMQSSLDALRLAAPKTVYCTKGNYSTALDDALLQMGFENVIHHGEEGLDIVSDLPEESGMWRIYASDPMDIEFSHTVDAVLTAKGNLLLEWDPDMFRLFMGRGQPMGTAISLEESVQSLMETFQGWEIGSVTQMRGLRLENHQRYLDSVEAARQPKIELENRIQSLKEQIEALQAQAGVK